MRIFMWHVHGSYMTNFLATGHEVFIPVTGNRNSEGLGRAQTWDWPANAIEVKKNAAQSLEIDLLILQRPEEYEWSIEWLGGRKPGTDVPAIFLEHNTPQGRINEMVHPFANFDGLYFVHVSTFNQLFWDCGRNPSTTIEHGVIDPGYRYVGDRPSAASVINDPVRRSRITGTDLLERMRSTVTVDLFGMKSERLGGQDLPQNELHEELGHRRLYVHLYRWTSMGLALIEAMLLGLPVVALDTTEASTLKCADIGVISNDLERCRRGAETFIDDIDLAIETGLRARDYALGRFGMDRFVDDWNSVIKEVAA